MPPPTSQHTIGPFFPAGFVRPGDNDLTQVTARGERILLRGRVTREGGVPCRNAILEAWQADAGGRFRHPADPEAAAADPDFRGWGRAATDAAGHYTFRTVLPGGFTEPAGRRAPHVALLVMASGLMRQLSTIVFFPDFTAANAADPVLALVPPGRPASLVAVEDGQAEGMRAFRFDLCLRGSATEETPFFVE